MTTLRIMVSLNMASGIPEDRSVNTFHVTGPTVPDPTGLNVVFQTYYTALKPWFPAEVAEFAHNVKVYNLADPEPRVAIYDENFDFATAPTGDPLPSEVALCVSYHVAYAPGEPKARYRGRHYIGPLNTTALGADGRPDPDLVTDAAGAFSDLNDDLASMDSWFLGVYSRTDATMRQPITGAWIDNAFDIQRRRGLAPTSRHNFTV